MWGYSPHAKGRPGCEATPPILREGPGYGATPPMLREGPGYGARDVQSYKLTRLLNYVLGFSSQKQGKARVWGYSPHAKGRAWVWG